MATYTENYNLILPEESDDYNVENFNENFETIDTLIAEADSGISKVNEKIGTPENGETIFSLLKTGGSIIKSIQRKTCTNTYNTTVVSIKINPVNSTKCVVFLERLKDASNISSVDYELTDTSIEVTMSNANTGVFAVGFWIIEFC